MSFLEHLDELRKRLIWAIGALGAGFLIALYFIDAIFGFIMRPLAATLPAGRKMIYTEPTEAFMLQLKVAALAGRRDRGARRDVAALAVHRARGCTGKEKRLALPFIVSTSVLFVAGAAFNHYVVFPIAFTFLGSFTKDYMEFMPRITPVFSLYSQLLLAFGLIFQMPVLVFTLARLGLVTAGFLWRNTKYADPDHLRHLGSHHADERRRHADADGRAHDPALRGEHRDRVGVRQEAACKSGSSSAADRPIHLAQDPPPRAGRVPGSFNGRTAPFEGAYRGSNPCPGAIRFPMRCLAAHVPRWRGERNAGHAARVAQSTWRQS